MARKLDQILVIDVEATCWQGAPPEGQESEIIEIGICRLDVATGKPLSTHSILVKPEKSRISEFCTQLTTLTHKQVLKKGISFSRACGILEREFLSKKRLWASFGDYDRSLFERQCAAHDVPYPFSSGHINVKSLFGIMQTLPYEVGMTRALEMLNMELEGVHHRGVDDAHNVARILARLLLEKQACS